METYTYNIATDGEIANGTSLVGYITTTYDALVEKLGLPRNGSADHKTTAQWILTFEDGTVGTIYDWKLSSTPKNPYKWHVGGRGVNTLNKVKSILGIKTQTATF